MRKPRTIARRSPAAKKTSPAKAVRPIARSSQARDNGTSHGAHPSLADAAYSGIEELIVADTLAPKTFVTETELSRLVGIGRTPVREALKRLEADRLVRIVPRRGIMITEVDVGHQLQLLEVRRELERLVAQRAARLAGEDEREAGRRLAEAIDAAARDGDERRFMHLDQECNDLLDRASRNEIANQTLRPLRSLSRRFWFHYVRRVPSSLLDGARTHSDLMRAIAAADPRRAALASDKLMDYVVEFARATIETI